MPDRLELNGQSVPERIGESPVSFAAPGLTGELVMNPVPAGGEAPPQTRSTLRDSAAPFTNDEVDLAIQEVGNLESYNLETPASTPAVPLAGDATRSGPYNLTDDEAALEYTPKPGEYSFVIYRDEAGVISLHFPENLPPAAATENVAPGTRAGFDGEVQKFRIPLRKPEVIPPATPGQISTRFGLVTIGKKLIKLVVGKIIKKAASPLMQAADYGAVYFWESRARAFQGFHDGATLDNLLSDNPVPMSDAKWQTLQGDGKKALLFIHGTTSNTSGGFAGLRQFPDAARQLYALYENRVLGFNHHTLTLSVADNVANFYSTLPENGNLSFDIVCHSRGGLVARALKEFTVAEVARRTKLNCTCKAKISIGKIVFVGTPNIGTQLADPEDIPQALEVLSNVAALIPGAGLTLAGIFSGAAFVAENGFKVLPGMRNMNPADDFLEQLNTPVASGQPSPAADYYAIQSNFSSDHLANQVLLAGVKYLFKDNLNDLIVPTLGTSNIDGAALTAKVVSYYGNPPQVESVAHTRYFNDSRTWNFIVESLI